MKQEEIIAKLKRLAKAYEIADENDYCTDEIPEEEGSRPDEIAGRIICLIKKL